MPSAVNKFKQRRSAAENAAEEGIEEAESDFNTVPEGCVASVLSLTTPRDVCRLSAVSTVFRSAADSNAVWSRFLPEDYESIIARSDDAASLRSLPPKDLYFRLCTVPTLIDEGTKRFWLDRCSGKKCVKLSSRSLSIAWGDTPSYWRWIPSSEPKSSFEEVAMLVYVWWLEIRGKMDTKLLSPGTRYGVYFVFKMVNAYGFEHQPVEVRVGVTDAAGEETVVVDKSVYLDIEGRREPVQFHRRRRFRRRRDEEEVEVEKDGPKQRKDGWSEVEMGELYVEEEGEEGKEVVMSLMEVKGGIQKGGLMVEGIELRPKEMLAS